jgi:hypothetical protein
MREYKPKQAEVVSKQDGKVQIGTCPYKYGVCTNKQTEEKQNMSPLQEMNKLRELLSSKKR